MHRAPLKARLVSTQENKDWIGLDFFPSCIIHTARPKNFNSLSSGLRITGSNWSRKLVPKAHARGFNFVLFWSDPMLIFLSGNRLKLVYIIKVSVGLKVGLLYIIKSFHSSKLFHSFFPDRHSGASDQVKKDEEMLFKEV